MHSPYIRPSKRDDKVACLKCQHRKEKMMDYRNRNVCLKYTTMKFDPITGGQKVNAYAFCEDKNYSGECSHFLAKEVKPNTPKPKLPTPKPSRLSRGWLWVQAWAIALRRAMK